MELELPRLLTPDLSSDWYSWKKTYILFVSITRHGSSVFLVTTSLCRDQVIYASAAFLRSDSRFSCHFWFQYQCAIVNIFDEERTSICKCKHIWFQYQNLVSCDHTTSLTSHDDFLERDVSWPDFCFFIISIRTSLSSKMRRDTRKQEVWTSGENWTVLSVKLISFMGGFVHWAWYCAANFCVWKLWDINQ